MNRDDFTRLPAAIALGLVWDHLELERHLGGVEAPKPPRPPKYDQRIYRKDGLQYASETDLDGLTWWHARYAESGMGGGQYAEKDAKNAERLAYWVAWRTVEPTKQWSGTRDDREVTAQAPSHKPTLYPKDGPRPAPKQPKHRTEDWPDDPPDAAEDLPF